MNKRSSKKTLRDYDFKPIETKSYSSNHLELEDDKGKDEQSNKFNEIISKLEENISIKSEPNLGNLVNFSGFESFPVQRWIKYREGFSIELVKKFIKDDSGRVIDPFCGSGTSLLAAKSLGKDSIGFDVNPLAVFISKVKTSDYTASQMDQLKKLVENILDIKEGDQAKPVPKLKIIDKIYNKDILDTLLRIAYKIDKVKEQKLQDFLKLGWISILESVSNVKKEGNGIKYKYVKRTKNGYVKTSQSAWENKTFGTNKVSYVINILRRKYSEMLSDLALENTHKVSTKVYCDSSLNIKDYIKQENVSTCIFSPPYANAFDYFEIFKVELWMGGFVNSYDDLLKLRKSAFRSNFNAGDIGLRRSEFSNKELENLLNLMTGNTWDPRMKEMLRGYFEDFYLTLKGIYQTLAQDGKCIIIVGNSAYAGTIIPTDLLLANIGREIGFDSPEIQITRSLTTSSQQKRKLREFKGMLRESVIILYKTSGPKEERVDEFPVENEIKHGQKFIITSNNVSYLTHNIHKYPAKFIPQIPRWAIKRYGTNKNSIVIDPFCGSGTTLVESMLKGFDSYGIDIDPLARLITKVKTTPIPESKLQDVIIKVVQDIGKQKEGKFLPETKNLYHWFTQEAVRKLSVIRDTIDSFKDERDIYDFLIVTFSSIIRKTSNADNESQKTYVSHTHIKTPEDPIILFKRNLYLYSERLMAFFQKVPVGTKARVISEFTDSRNFADEWNKNIGLPIDIAITSPPYIKAVDYVYNQMAEYFWIGDLFDMQNQKLQTKRESNYMGTKHVAINTYSEFLPTGYKNIDKISQQIYAKNKKFSYVLSKFFIDMEKNIQEMYKVMRTKGHYVIVIGANQVAEIPVPSHEFIINIAEGNGFKLSNLFSYKIRNHYMSFPRKGRGGLIDEDWIVDLEKT